MQGHFKEDRVQPQELKEGFKSVIVILDHCNCGMSCKGRQQYIRIIVPEDCGIMDGARISGALDFENLEDAEIFAKAIEAPVEDLDLPEFKGERWNPIYVGYLRVSGIEPGDPKEVEEPKDWELPEEMSEAVTLYVLSRQLTERIKQEILK